MKMTVTALRRMKEDGDKIAMLTCYDYSTAKLMEEAGVEALLVGDSLGNTVLGYEDTLPVTMEDMLRHTAAVARGKKDALLIADMPFLSYQTSSYDAVVNAGRLVKEGGANVVKLEGGAGVCPRIEAVAAAGIPVCAHIGLTPQSVNALGGFKVQGKSEEAARALLADAKRVEGAGASLVVLEGIPAKLAALITSSVGIPTIGIGAGAGCDGQVLVCQDMLGMFQGYKPRFVRQFADVGGVMTRAFSDYKREVKAGTFPAKEHTYPIADEVIGRVSGAAAKEGRSG